MDEKRVREVSCLALEKLINEGLSTIHTFINSNVNYYTLYPLKFLEDAYQEDAPESVYSVVKRGVISWYLAKSNKHILDSETNTEFSEDEYKLFCEKFYPALSNLYQDYRILREMKDHRSIAKSLFLPIDDDFKTFNLKTALVTDKYRVEAFYFNGMHDQNEFRREFETAVSTEKKFIRNMEIKSRSDFRRNSRMHIDIDTDLLSSAISRVSVDTNKLTFEFSSKVIVSNQNMTKFLGCLYYFALTRKTHNDFLRISNQSELINEVLDFDRTWLINKICKMSKLNSEEVENYIDYLTIRDGGSLFEFPLVATRNKVFFNSSSIILNDWHFNLVNGHYLKEILINRKDETVSTKAVEDIFNTLKNYANIEIAMEYKYEFIDDNGKKVNSDIDLAVYDKINNKLLIVECKWKENHYISEGDTNYFKVEKTLYDIYLKQISKHRLFIVRNPVESINSIFNMEVVSEGDLPEVLYIATDKRYQLHIDEMHMLTSYQLPGLFSMFSENNVVDFNKLFDEIRSLKSKAEYTQINELKQHTFGEFNVMSDELRLDYNLNIV